MRSVTTIVFSLLKLRCLQTNGTDKLIEIIHNPVIEAVKLSAPLLLQPQGAYLQASERRARWEGKRVLPPATDGAAPRTSGLLLANSIEVIAPMLPATRTTMWRKSSRSARKLLSVT